MKLIKNSILIFLCAVFGFSVCGCAVDNSKPPEPTPDPPKPPYEYQVAHESTDNIALFKSSDKGLDSFLNTFFEKHSRYSDDRIHPHPVGLGNSAWKEWESLIGNWWDSSNRFNQTIPAGFATKDFVTDWLLNPKQDNQGYIWCDDGSSAASWELGWAFPNYESAGSNAYGTEFSVLSDGWKSPGGSQYPVTNGFLEVSGDQLSEIAVEKDLTESSVTPFYAPFVKTGWKFQNWGEPENIDDLYLYYQVEGDNGYSEEKCVKYSEFCITGSKITGDVSYNTACFPMYVDENWGKSADKSNIISKIKLVMKAKPGKKIGGKMYFDFFRAECDDRQINNLGTYITAAKNVMEFSQDAGLLAHIMPKVRRAMQNYLELMNGKTGLVDTSYYVGHDGKGYIESGNGIGNGFWDIGAYPDKNIYCNTMFYRAVQSMLFLEEMCLTYNVNAEMPSILSKDMKTTSAYKQTILSLKVLEAKVKTDFTSYFWNEKTGRFIGGYYENDLKDPQDNGFLLFNLEAVAAGLCSDEQRTSIMEWVEGRRIVKGDNSTGADIYRYDFAPRFNTKQIVGDYVWTYNGCTFGAGVHNGGAVMQSSYYDIIARNNYGGADDAYSRLKDIQTWFEAVQAAGGVGQEFYREYYKLINIGMQGGATGGPVGLDFEFLEAALMYSSIPTAFFGIKPTSQKIVEITPSMPSKLDFWRIENMTYASFYYDCSIGKNFVQLSEVRGKDGTSNSIEGHSIKINLKIPTGAYKVLYNGVEISSSEVEGKVTVIVPFTNGKVEIVV